MARTASISDTSLPPKRVLVSCSESTSTESQSSESRRSKRSIPRTDMPVSATGTRKRVNPDSLAARLGPELVEELEALLKSGMTEMPPFSVRQAIQKRYNINRRHIYDWFHSKGLRVTKEDRRALQGQAGFIGQRKLRQYSAPSSMPELSYDTSHDSMNSNSSSPNLLLTPVHNAGTFDTSGGNFSEVQQSYLASRYFTRALYAPSFDHDDLLGNLNSCISCLPEDATASSPAEDNKASSEKFPIQRITEGLQPAVRSPGTSPTSALDFLKQNVDPLVDDQYLSEPERRAIYESLSNILGPACGIQESVGTYKAYMLKQTEMYYERILPSDTDSTSCDRAPEAGQSPSAVSVSLPEISVSGHTTTQTGPPLQSAFANVDPSASQTVAQLYSWFPYASHADKADLPAEPNTALDISEILESPVLRSRNASGEHAGACIHAQAQEWRPNIEIPSIPGYQMYGIPMAPVYPPAVMHPAHSWENDRVVQYAHFPAASMWARGDFALTLQNAKSTLGLEKTVQDKSRTKIRGRAHGGGRPERSRMNSASDRI